MEADNFPAEFVKDEEKAIPSSPPECWDPPLATDETCQTNKECTVFIIYLLSMFTTT